MVKIYHNPRCTKSRQGLALLKEHKVEPEIIEYLKETLTKKEVQSILKLLGISAYDLLRRKEAIFKEQFKGAELSEEQWIDAMVKYPKLIERPIIINGDKAVIGRPTEKILEIL